MATLSSTLCFSTGSFEIRRQPQIWIAYLTGCRQVPNDKISIRRTELGVVCEPVSTGAWLVHRDVPMPKG